MITYNHNHGLTSIMKHVKHIEIRKGVDIGYHSSNIHPIDREGCVGVSD